MFSHATSNSKGIVILFSKNLEYKIIKEIKDIKGWLITFLGF